MAKAPTKKKKKRKSATKAKDLVKVAQKNAFEANFGEGTSFDLDYGKLVNRFMDNQSVCGCFFSRGYKSEPNNHGKER